MLASAFVVAAASPAAKISFRGTPTQRAWLSMAEMQFAAGAREVLPVHEMAKPFRSWPEAREGIPRLPLKPILARVVSAHVMGGCGMAGNERLGVVRPDGRHWQVENLSVHDGSIFPTSIGANPQELSLVERTDEAGGTKLARYQQKPFRYPLRGDYGKLMIRFRNDGKLVAFVGGTMTSAAEAYLRNLAAGRTVRISKNYDGTANPPRWSAFNAVITQNGRYVMFTHASPKIVRNDTNGAIVGVPLGWAIYLSFTDAIGGSPAGHWGGFDDSDENFQRWTRDPKWDPSLFAIAWDGNEIAGGVINQINEAENAAFNRKRGWLASVFVRRPWRRRGLGRAVVLRSLQIFRDRGMTSAGLGVDADNPTGALGLYTGTGFEVDRRSTAYRKPMPADA